jgi:cytochrome c oxidase assembly factor CtaG
LLTDLHLGGAIMWVGGDSLMLLAMIPVVLQWIKVEEAKAIEVDRQLDEDRFADRRGQVQI